MPITLPETLPAFDVLSAEGVMVMGLGRAQTQEIRPLRIALLNLMPKKIQTENQFARLIGATPLQIDFQLIRMSEHQTKNTAAEHMEQFYRPFDEVKASGEKFDGLIITGAPIEHLMFDDVTYWNELKQVFDWTQTHVHSTFGVCWGGMAMINYFHGVKKHVLENKAFGLFRQNNLMPSSPYLRGFSDECHIPVSRWTEMHMSEIEAAPGLVPLLGSEETGPCLVQDQDHRALYIFNHFEYDTGTLHQELMRDKQDGKPILLPQNYYQNDDPTLKPVNRWRSHAHLLYGNWINEIYQSTHYDLDKIGS